MKIIRKSAIVIARFLISSIFLCGAVNKIFNWHETEKFLMNILCDWQSYIGYSEGAQNCITFLTPWSPLLLMAATLFELIGGLLVLLGIKEKLGAVLLILFLIPTTILIHQFWFIEGSARELQTVMFLKNLAILGGLLLILCFGASTNSEESDPYSSMKMN
ncbi:MAG: DoxX family membrane protein [Chlamydiota bacterium]